MRFIKKGFFLKVVIPAIAVLMLANTMFGVAKAPKRKEKEPLKPVVISDYTKSVSGIGVTEPKSEEIQVGTNISGVVTKVYVKIGDIIKKGDKLFTIDDRKARANLELKKAELESAKLDAVEKRAEFEMYRVIVDKRAYSRDEYNKKKLGSQIAAQNLKRAQAQIKLVEIEIEKSTVRSPIDGDVLELEIKEGEYAQAADLSNPLMVLGDISNLNVRVEVDETQAHLVLEEMIATAYLRGNPGIKVPLKFIRIEPKMIPKLSISGGAEKKIDSRVMQVIYAFDVPNDMGILVGQQMDVYIENAQETQTAKETKK